VADYRLCEGYNQIKAFSKTNKQKTKTHKQQKHKTSI